MNNKKKKQELDLSIIDAVEALADIADMEFGKEVSSAHIDELNEQNQKVISQTVKSLDLTKEDPDSTVQGIRETFHVVLEYLQNFYADEYRHMGSERALEGVKEIMMIAGEAAKNLDQYTTIFKRAKEKSANELEEYKLLQEFYETRIARKIDQGVLGKWILELTKGAMNRSDEIRLKKKRENRTRHVFIDMDSVKKDTDYDLFFMKKEDGTRFFNPNLIRNIKLVCDFGDRLSGVQKGDALEDTTLWEDRVTMESAKNILHSLGPVLDRYYKETSSHGQRLVVKSLNKTLMALYLGGNERNLMKNIPAKCCLEYFVDFQKFLRQTIKSSEYQKWMSYPPKLDEPEARAIMDMIHAICRGIMVNGRGYQAFIPTLEVILADAFELLPVKERRKNITKLHKSLLQKYESMGRVMKTHPHGPLMKVLSLIGSGVFKPFSPICQSNIPTEFYSMYDKENKMTNIRMPSPTYQEFVNKVTIIDEFKGLLRSYKSETRKKVHLMFNLQDRTSWREHFRSIKLEKLQEVTEFKGCLDVVTFAKDTEFYDQLSPYSEDKQAKIFIEHFKEQLQDPSCGFYFPEKIRDALFPRFIDKLISAVHTVFFSKMNVLTIENRKVFIEMIYLFIQLKILEMVKPDTFSFTCKDGVDTGGASSVQLFLFMKLINGESLSDADQQQLDLMLYGAPILIRERNMLPNRFHRTVETVKRLEESIHEYGQKGFEKEIEAKFAPLFDTLILKGMLLPPK